VSRFSLVIYRGKRFIPTRRNDNCIYKLLRVARDFSTAGYLARTPGRRTKYRIRRSRLTVDVNTHGRESPYRIYSILDIGFRCFTLSTDGSYSNATLSFGFDENAAKSDVSFRSYRIPRPPFVRVYLYRPGSAKQWRSCLFGAPCRSSRRLPFVFALYETKKCRR